MGFFKKKEEENLSKDIIESNSIPSNSNVSVNTDKLTADVDKLKSSMEANSELRQVYSEKFSRINENIGELKNMLVDREKDISKIEVAATKAADLVSEVQPEALLSEVRKGDVKIEGLKDKLESYHELNHTIMDELKDIKRVVKTFRGIDDVRDMLKDAHKDIGTFEKIEDIVESHSDKIEDVYTDFLKKFDEFKEFKDSLNDIKQKIGGYEEEFDKIKDSNKEVIKKSEFNNFSTKIHDFINALEKKLKDVHVSMSFIEDIKELVSSLESEIGTIISEVGDVKKQVKHHSEFEPLLGLLKSKYENNEIVIASLKENMDKIEEKLLAQQELDTSDFEQRMLILEKTTSRIDETIDGFSEGLIVTTDGQFEVINKMQEQINYLTDKLDNSAQSETIKKLENKVDHLSNKLDDAEEREAKIIHSVQNVISLIERLSKEK